MNVEIYELRIKQRGVTRNDTVVTMKYEGDVRQAMIKDLAIVFIFIK